MSEFLPADFPAIYLLPATLVVVLLLLVWLWIRHRRSRRPTMASVFAAIAFERIDSLIVPNADEGEIQIDHLLLTSRGLLIIDIKDVSGTVFGSDKMENWTVISDKHRFTFANPKPGLYDRIAAVRHIVRQVPVEGRLVFLDGALFTKGVPDLVATIDDLFDEFHEADKASVKFKIEAFKPHWDLIRKAALRGEVSELAARRGS